MCLLFEQGQVRISAGAPVHLGSVFVYLDAEVLELAEQHTHHQLGVYVHMRDITMQI